MIFIEAKSRQEVTDRKGFDWYKIVKVNGGYMLFETRSEYENWKKQK